MPNLSVDYDRALEESRRHHQASKTYSGLLALRHAEEIRRLIVETKSATVLDYGCGKGLQYEEPHSLEVFWGVAVTKYDPAWPAFANEPVGKFDLVICTHSLGTIPLTDQKKIVDRLYSLSRKAIYIGEMIGPVKKQVFSRPELHPGGFDKARWAEVLARPRSTRSVLLGTFRADDASGAIDVSVIQ